MGINKNKYLECDLSSSLPSLPLHLPTRPPHLSKATLLRLKLLTAASNLPSSLPVNRLSGDSDPFSKSTDLPLLDLLATPSKLTWAWPRPAPRRKKSSGDPSSRSTDLPLLDLLVKPSLLTWAWPRPTPSRTTSSGDPSSRSTDLPLLDLLATPSKPTWAWPRPTPAPVRKKSSGDPFSANMDPPLLSLLATPSKPTWAWPRLPPVLRRRRSCSEWPSQPTASPPGTSAFPKMPLPRRLSSGDPFSANTDPPLLNLLATPSKLT